MLDRKATSELLLKFVRVRATTRSIYLGVSPRKIPLGPQKGNHLLIPLMRKKRKRKGRGKRKMTREMRKETKGVRKMRGTSLKEER